VWDECFVEEIVPAQLPGATLQSCSEANVAGYIVNRIQSKCKQCQEYLLTSDWLAEPFKELVIQRTFSHVVNGPAGGLKAPNRILFEVTSYALEQFCAVLSNVIYDS